MANHRKYLAMCLSNLRRSVFKKSMFKKSRIFVEIVNKKSHTAEIRLDVYAPLYGVFKIFIVVSGEAIADE
jgi:hypothetical protein